MPSIRPLEIHLANATGGTTSATVQCQQWSKADARRRALRWGGGLFVVCLVMLPIPLVHFAIIPVLLIGLPVILITVYKLYSNGTDLRGAAKCPDCSATIQLDKSADDWPINLNCPKCQAAIMITRPEMGL